MPTKSFTLYLLIVGCEVAFWLVLLLSLAVRYLLKREVLSRWLVGSLPLIDLLLLGVTARHLSMGTSATLAHGLAAVYVGFTIAFGSTVIRWADENFAYRFASGPPPAGAATSRWKAVRLELQLWLRCIVAWIIALGLIEALTAYVGNETLTEPLHVWHKRGFACVFFWFVFGPSMEFGVLSSHTVTPNPGSNRASMAATRQGLVVRSTFSPSRAGRPIAGALWHER